MPITESGGTIKVTGYSVGTPCDMAAIYAADVAGGWGVVTKQGALQYRIYGNLDIGDAATDGHFASESEQIEFDSSNVWNSNSFRMFRNSTARFGKLLDGVPMNGSAIFTTTLNMWSWKIGDNSTLYLYATKISCIKSGSNYSMIRQAVTNTIIGKEVHLDGIAYGFYSSNVGATTGYHLDLENTVVQNCKYFFGAASDVATLTLKDIAAHKTIMGMYIYSDVSSDIVMENYIQTTSTYLFDLRVAVVDCYMINAVVNTWLSQYGGATTSKIYRQHTLDLKVVDDAGAGEPTVQVNIWDDDDDEKVDTTTNGSGVLAQQKLDYGYYDRTHASTPVMKTPHTMKLYKYGMNMSKSKFEISAATDWTLTMYDNDYITEATEATVAAYTGIAINHTTGTITISEDHTMAEIYDYLQYDIKENPQLAIDETIATADGVNFTSQYNFVVNTGITVTATDKKLTMITGKTYTLTGTGDFTGIIADQTKTRVPVVLKSVIDGSRYRIEKTSDGMMVFEGTQSGAGDITNYYEHTVNLGVKVKVRKSDPAGTRYYPVETTGTITDTKFSLTISQEEDGQANSDASSPQISLDAGTKIISITTPKIEITIQELLNAIRDWEDELVNLEYAGVINTGGKLDLGGGVETGLSVALSSLWQVQFYGGSGYTTVKGGTLAGGVGNEPVKASGTANDITVQIQPTDSIISGIGSVEDGIDDIKGTGFTKDIDSLKQNAKKAKDMATLAAIK